MIFDTIETPRLLLQKLSSEVMTTIFKENDKKEIKSILGLNDDEFEYQQNIYKEGYDSYNQSMLNFQLVEKISNKIIGNCGFHTWNSKHQRAEIGYDLRFVFFIEGRIHKIKKLNLVRELFFSRLSFKI